MMIAKAKNIFRVALLVVVFLSAFSFNIGTVSASSCWSPPSILIAAYEQGTFVDGFEVTHRSFGGRCNERPVVSDEEHLQSHFYSASQRLSQPISSGVYQLEAQCWTAGMEEWCAKGITLKQISNNPLELTQYRSEWQQKERDGLKSFTTHLWSTVASIVAVVALALLWPWILVRIWPNLRKRLSLILIVAILLQAWLVLNLVFFPWDYDLWVDTVGIALIVLLVSIVGEIIFLVVKKIRSRNVTV